ncbi:MAG: glycosyltransferase, partial [Anaerolineales bacterium]|nr:glycosyltransferase [Anaerolineales bacterium]
RSEHKVFNTADAISVTTAETHQAYATRFSNCATKIYVIPPLLSIQEELEGYPPIFPRDDMIRLVYVGRLYADGRRPDFLLKLFTILLQTPLEDRIELHFFGDARAVEESFVAYNSLINEKIFLHGQVEHDIAARAMYDASVLINIGNKSPYQLPSKVVEYASTGKPILNIAQIECDSSMGFFKSYPVVINLIDTGGSNIENQAEDLFNFLSHLPEQLDTKYVNETLMPFQIDAIAAMYLDII